MSRLGGAACNRCVSLDIAINQSTYDKVTTGRAPASALAQGIGPYMAYAFSI